MTCRRIAVKALLVLFGVSQLGYSRNIDEENVYESLFAEFGEPGRTYVIREDVEEFNQHLMVAADRVMIKDFKFTNESPKLKSDAFGVVSVKLLSRDTYIELFDRCATGWAAFHKRFPLAKVLISLSHVAVHSNGKEAFVLMHWASACLGGRWELIFFKYDGQKWKFSRSVNMGVS
jgi:hypothetical protein